MQINIQKVVEQLAQRIAQLETEKAIAQAHIDAMTARIEELEQPAETDADTSTTAGKVAAKEKA